MKKVTRLILDSGYNINTTLKCMNDLLVCIEKNEFNGSGFRSNKGICANILNRDSVHQLQHIMNHWPNHSGYPAYPVKSGRKYRTPCGMYHFTGNKYIGAYGKRRINLLKWLITEFEVALKHSNKR